jgi:ADP-ribose pyrophosphatase YjhB (NUDIX family)
LNLFWRPREEKLYRSWIGDEKHSVSVDAQVEGYGYSAAFKISGESCELWLFPVNVRVRRKTDSFSESITRRALVLNLLKKDIDISKQMRKDILEPGQVQENRANFTWVRYAVKIKRLSDEDELRLLEWQKSASIVPERQIVRKRGTAIIENGRGILVVSSTNRLFLLPGAGVKEDESRKDAVIRELGNGLGLETKSCRYLFSFDEPEDKKLRSLHEVFLVEIEGEIGIRPVEKRRIDFWREDSKLKLGNSSSLIIDRYVRDFKASIKA